MSPIVALMLAGFVTPAVATKSSDQNPVHCMTVKTKTQLITLGNSALALVSEKQSGEPLPLVILFHGAGQGSETMIAAIQPIIDQPVAILAIKSKGKTWDLVTNLASESDFGSFNPNRARALPAGDKARVAQAIRELAAQYPLSDQRLVIGFSDGASYALSLASYLPDQYPIAIAIAPGMVQLPAIRPKAAKSQQIHILYGDEDRIFTPRHVENEVAPAVRRNGATITMHRFSGGHQIDTANLAQLVRPWLCR